MTGHRSSAATNLGLLPVGGCVWLPALEASEVTDMDTSHASWHEIC